MVPALMNTVVSLQKDVALVSVLGVREAVREAQIITVPHVQLHRLRGRHRAVPGRSRSRSCASSTTSPQRDRAAAHAGGGVSRPSRRRQARVDGLTKRYGDRVVLDGIDLAVDDHEVVCLIGSSGSGKSTLLRCIDLLDPIDGGRILLDGEDITAPGANANAVRRRIGIVFQSFNLFPHMTVHRQRDPRARARC